MPREMSYDSITMTILESIPTLSDDLLDGELNILHRRACGNHIKARLEKELRGAQPSFTNPGFFDAVETNVFSVNALEKVLKFTGLYKRGQRNVRNIQLNRICHDVLPAGAESFRMLQLSDLHIDLSDDFLDIVISRIRKIECEFVVLTGDYRFSTAGSWEPACQAMTVLANEFDAPCYAVLGNHDCMMMVPSLERGGIRVLLNESIELHQKVWLSGVDDPHYFRCDDLPTALESVPDDSFKILLAHSPEIYQQASESEINMLLCGHTHGGQIRLPFGVPLTINAKCPRRMGSGLWRHGDMLGYTSVGTGSSLLDVRLNCLPEVTLHEFQSSTGG